MEIGATHRVGEYEVQVVSFQPDASSAIAAANQFNDPPENGRYALVGLEVTYIGEDEGNPGLDLTVALSGSDRRQYADSDCFAIEPDSMIDAPTLEPGGTASGNFCLDYPPDALGSDALLFVEPLFSFDRDDRAFWRLG